MKAYKSFNIRNSLCVIYSRLFRLLNLRPYNGFHTHVLPVCSFCKHDMSVCTFLEHAAHLKTR